MTRIWKRPCQTSTVLDPGRPGHPAAQTRCVVESRVLAGAYTAGLSLAICFRHRTLSLLAHRAHKGRRCPANGPPSHPARPSPLVASLCVPVPPPAVSAPDADSGRRGWRARAVRRWPLACGLSPSGAGAGGGLVARKIKGSVP